MTRSIPFLITAVAGFSFSVTAGAELSLPNFFNDHMVVQRDKPVAIWGTAGAGASVEVSLADRSASTTANAKGDWRVSLPSLPANSSGTELTITSDTDKKVIKDVLVGEVWFASGQSNMAFKVAGSHEAAADIAKADHPGIRMFLANLTPAAEPQANIGGVWAVCSPQTVTEFSAVGYFFALELHNELGLPVGIISSSWGGKPIETFTSRGALASIPEGRSQLEKLDKMVAAYDPEVAKSKLDAALAKYNSALAEWKSLPKEKRGRAPVKPFPQRNPAATEGRPAALYNGMIHPFAGYAMRGAIWYQGEANAKTPASATAYGKLFPLLIADWRKQWDDEFTFLWVQLANFKKPANTPGVVDSWAQLQNEQRKSLTLPKSGMAVINDIGTADDIHPKNKKEVGRRLALWALSGDYGRDVTPCGPLYRDCSPDGQGITIRFENGKGLKSRDGGPLRRFEIAGEDGVWQWADAVIDGDTLIVSSSKVPAPKHVRYAWCSNPEGANLVNGDDLPASVFSTE